MTFLWGAATSSHQIEGYNDKNDWWQWESEGRIEGGICSGAAIDHRNRMKQDIHSAANLGLDSYRFSVEWSRIEPEEGRFDPVAIEWYRELIHECERHKLLPMLTLHHFTSPQWFAAKGGFTWSQSPEKFANFVAYTAKNLGSRIPLWITFNEPMVLVVGTYLGKFMPPGEFSTAKASLACHNLLKAHVLAYEILKQDLGQDREGPWRHLPLEIGIAHNMLDFLPDRRWHPLEGVLAWIFKRFYNDSWLNAVTGRKQHFGVPGLMPYAKPVKEALGKRTVDFIGVNYYTKAYVQWHPKDASISQIQTAELPIGLAFARRKEPASDLGWAIHPKGLGKMLRSASRYHLPLYITENGIADREDRLRPQYLESHLREVALAIENGIDIRGYYHWSLFDNFEWVKGFWPRFGLYHINYDTFERTLTRSAQLYQQIIAHHKKKDQGM